MSRAAWAACRDEVLAILGTARIGRGILTEQETVILSTHLLEEVKDFISRAVLLREGRIVGDHTVDELEDAGEDLMSCIKRTYDYRGDRIQKTIRDLTEEGEA